MINEIDFDYRFLKERTLKLFYRMKFKYVFSFTNNKITLKLHVIINVRLLHSMVDFSRGLVLHELSGRIMQRCKTVVRQKDTRDVLSRG